MSADLTKEQRISREKSRLRRLFKELEPARFRACAKLIEQVAFMGVTLEDLATHINEHGCTSDYQNGENQWGTKKSPEVEIHTSMMQRYLSALKQLTDMLPEGPKTPQAGRPGDKLMGYIDGEHGRP